MRLNIISPENISIKGHDEKYFISQIKKEPTA